MHGIAQQSGWLIINRQFCQERLEEIWEAGSSFSKVSQLNLLVVQSFEQFHEWMVFQIIASDWEMVQIIFSRLLSKPG